MLPGVCPRRCTTSRVWSPTATVSPCSTGRVTGTGRSAASAGWATVVAPVASTTSGSARWWSQCPCVVTTVRTSASPIIASSAGASAAASTSSDSPVAVEVSR
jgi:hypothetical protein